MNPKITKVLPERKSFIPTVKRLQKSCNYIFKREVLLMLSVLLFSNIGLSWGQTTLVAGDISVIAYNTSGSPDNLAILVLKNLSAGTQFYVNDNEVATAGGSSFTDLNEVEASFTVKPGQTILAGTVIVLPWGTGAVSTTTYDWTTTSSAGLGNNNEEIYIYTAASITSTTPTAFIYFAKIGTSTSAVPNGLALGSTAISPSGSALRYKTSSATYNACKSILLTAIANTTSNWNTTGATSFASADWTFTVQPTCATTVNLSVSANAGTEIATTAITVTATISSVLGTDQTVSLAVTGTDITAGDYTLSNNQITISAGNTTGSETFTVVNDLLAEAEETATLTISNPSSGIILGNTTSQNIIITDDDAVANTAPTIIVNVTNTSDYIDGAVIASPASPYAFSGVISDPTDPASTLGFVFSVNDAETIASSLTMTAVSSNTTVVPASNLSITGLNDLRTLTIIPASVGYSTITVTIGDGVNTASYIINYAASAEAANTSATRFHLGRSDASTSVMVDANYMFVADDENQALRLYNRTNSGLSINAFDYTTSLGLTDFSSGIPREVDIEASAKVGSRIYWLGSHDNSSSGANRPNRSRIFATDITGSGYATTLSYVGRFDDLKTDLLNWDQTNGHGLGANYLGLVASAAVGVIPEAANGSGFNIEGLEMAPDNTTAYISFRAPIVPVSARTQALIVPVTNFTALFSGNPTSGTSAIFGAPIQLNLGGRGIREIKKNASGKYIIVAGPVDAATDVAPSNFVLYSWTGNPDDAPYALTTSLSSLALKGSFEGIVNVPDPLINGSQVQLSVDNGDAVFYNDAIIAKDLAQANHKKSTSLMVTVSGLIFPSSAPVITTITPGNGQLNVAFSPPSSDGGSAITDYKYSTDGGVSYVSAGTTTSPILITGLTNGTTYTITLLAVNLAGDGTPSAGVNGTPVLPVVPTITTSTLTLQSLTTVYGTASIADSFDVAGTNLSNDIVITAPTGFEISPVSNSTGYSASLTLGQSSGTVSDTTIYIRIKDDAIVLGNYNSQIVSLTSTGAATVNISTTAAGNIVTPKALNVSGLSTDNKVYNGDALATFTGTPALNGVVGLDVVNLSGTGSALFNSKNAGVAKPVTVSGYLLTGADSANYSLAIVLSANITPAPLTISGAVAQNKQFDGTANAIITGTLTGIISPDVVSLNGTGTFASSAVGNAIAVTSTSTLAGADSANYEINPQPAGLTANITPGPTVLAIGDISIIGFNLNAPDNFAFVTWVDLVDNTIIKFTDNGFLSSASANQANNGRGGENFVIWKNNTGTSIQAGTVITLQDNGTSSTNVGTIISGNLSGLSASGDNIFAYQGMATSGAAPDWSSNTNPTTFNGTILFGLYAQGSSSVTNWLTTGTASSNSSYLPSDLNVPNANIVLAASSSKGQYSGSRNNQSTMSAYKAIVTNNANWTKASGAGVITLNTTSFTLATGPTASVISNGTGATTICTGDSANIKVDITGGLSPYDVIINDGTSNTTYTNYVSGSDINVTPGTTKTYTLTSVSDANSQPGIGNSGSATVTVNAAPTLTTQTINSTCGADSVDLTTGITSSTFDLTLSYYSDSALTVIATNPVNTSRTYYVLATNLNSCTASAAIVVNFLTNPVAIITNNSGTTVLGCGTTSISVVASGGSSYSWSDTSGVIATTDSLNVTEAGNYIVTVTNTSGCTDTASVFVSENIVTASVSITVSPNDTICSGAQLTFTATPVNGGADPIYQWQVNGVNAGVDSSLFIISTLNDSDEVNVIMTSNEICVSNISDTSNVIAITVNPALNPVITGPAAFCPGDSVLLNAGAGYTSYLWSNGATTQNIYVSVTSNLTVAVSNANCSGVSGSLQVTADTTIASIFPTGTIAICGNDSILLIAPSNPNYTYLWTTGETTAAIYADDFDEYSVTITNQVSGCISTTAANATVIVNSMPTDLNESGATTITDFLMVLGKFNTTCPSCIEDINNDGAVNILDFLAVLGSFNVACN